MQIRFVLVRPAYPTNMGATARAMKTMGFDELFLVAPQRSHREEKAVKLARAADDVLENATICESLSEALRDVDLVIGTSNRKRIGTKRVVASRDLGPALAEKVPHVQKVAFLFGPERTGLYNEELAHCDWYSYIPTVNEQPSFNLAQAVNIYCYELGHALNDVNKVELETVAGRDEEYRFIKESVAELMEKVGLPASERNHRLILSRLTELNSNDLLLAHTLRAKIRNSLTQ